MTIIEKEINNRQQLDDSIKTNSIKLYSLKTQHDTLMIKRLQAENECKGYEGYPKESLNHKKSIEAKKRAEIICKEIDLITDEIKQLTKTIDTYKARLDTIKIVVTTPQLIEYQNAIKADQEKAESINNLILEQKRIVDGALVKIDTAEALRKQRGLLRAESVTGIDNAKNIDAIDADIAKAEKFDFDQNQAKARTIQKAKETIDGLSCILDKANQTMTIKKRTLTFMYDDLLCKMARESAEKYKEAAYHLADNIREIIAIDALIEEAGIRKNSGICPSSPRTIRIPSLSNMVSSNDIGDYFYLDTGVRPSANEIAKVMSLLSKKGINVL